MIAQKRCIPLCVAVLLGFSSPSPGVVIHEIMYHPQTDEAILEYVELYNEGPIPADISGWYFSDGIQFVFPEGTRIAARDTLVVCRDKESASLFYGTSKVIGNFDGRLDNGGERISLSDAQGVVMSRVRYNDRGRWPGSPDGTGHSLSLLDPYLDPDDRESWAPSLARGGTPGAPNGFPSPGVPRETVLINEVRLGASGVAFVEIYNPTPSRVDLGGGYLSDDANVLDRYMVPNGVGVDGFKFAVLDASILGPSFSLDPQGAFVILTDASGSFVHDARHVEASSTSGSRGRFPDGTPGDYFIATPSPGQPNRPDLVTDVVINEIHYHSIPRDEHDQFIELYNRGTAAVDLSGFRFSEGVDYTMPPETVIHPGQYLVIAKDPERIERRYGLAFVYGPYEGVLAYRGERLQMEDLFGNPVDEVRYYDGGRWPEWADGGGSSLELIDPRQDNSFAAAWGSSDETPRSDWKVYEYTATQGSGESEFHMLLLGAGEVLIDDMHLLQGATEMLPDGSFEANPHAWVWGGTHVLSRRTTEDRYVGAYAMHLIASDRGETGPSRIERDTNSLASGTTYRVRYAARWLRGNRWLLTRTYNQGVAKATPLEVPERSGTPGMENSIAIENLGPVVADVRQDPVAPTGAQSVRVTARVQDADGIDRVLARYKTGGGGFTGTTIIAQGETWRYFKGTREPPTDWKSVDFVDTSWLPGATGIGYGDGDDETNLTDMQGNYISVYMRRSFNLATLDDLDHPVLLVTVDDGFVGYVNGTEVGRARISGSAGSFVPYSTAAANQPSEGVVEEFDLRPYLNRFQVGKNVLAIQVHNTSMGSSDLSMIPILGNREEGGDFVPVAMFDDGNHADGAPGDGVYGGTIPPSSGNVEFYVEAVDTRGAAGFYPTDAPDRTALYRVGAGSGNPDLCDYHLLMTDENKRTIDSRSGLERMSNHLLDATFVHSGKRIFYNVKTRRRGSAFTRPSGWRIEFNPDEPFRQGLESINMDPTGATGQHDRFIEHMIRGFEGPNFRQEYVRFRVNGGGSSLVEEVHPINRDYIQAWWPNEGEGHLYKVDDHFEYRNDSGSFSNDQAEIVYYGPDKESYRWNWRPRAHGQRDEFQQLIEMIRIMDPAVTGDDSLYDAIVEKFVHVDQWLRTLAVRALVDDWDTLGLSRGKNAYIYRPYYDGRFWLIPWDSDLTFGNTNATVVPGGHCPGVNRMIARPHYRHYYLSYLHHLINGPFTRAVAQPWLAEPGFLGVGDGGILGFIDNRIPVVQGYLSGPAFNITTNGGNPVTVTTETAVIEGTAPVSAYSFAVGGRVYDRNRIEWTNETTWRIVVPVDPGRNDLQIIAYDYTGDQVGADTIVVNSNYVAPPEVRWVIPEEGSTGGNEEVLVTGRRFLAGAKVYLGGVEAKSVVFESSRTLYVLTPAAAGPGPVDVRVVNVNELEGSMVDGYVYYEPRPIVISVEPDEGSSMGGGEVSITGKMFPVPPDEDVEVRFGGVMAEEVTYVSRTRLVAAAPPGSGTVDITVTNVQQGLSGTLPWAYTYTGPRFIRGDANIDGRLGVADVFVILADAYMGIISPCRDACDVDDNGTIGAQDALSLLMFIYGGVPAPKTPYPDPGADPSQDSLGCARPMD